MEKQFPIQFRVVNQPSSAAPRQQRHAHTGDRGRYTPSTTGNGGKRTMTVLRNPKHPKSLYDVEVSMRKAIKGKPVKLTPGLSFPDPKLRPLSNPRAPRFHFDFDPAPDDYNFVRNPLIGAIEDDEDNVDTLSRYISTADYGSSSDSDNDKDSVDVGQFPIQDDDDTQFDYHRDRDSLSSSQIEDPLESSYPPASKLRPHRVREAAQLMEALPPSFEPQPPPPRAPIDPVLVIPRAVVREEEAHPELRSYREQIKNGGIPYENNNNVVN